MSFRMRRGAAACSVVIASVIAGRRRGAAACAVVIASVVAGTSCAPAPAPAPTPGAPSADPSHLTIGGGQIDVEIEDGPLDLSRAQLMAWISSSASAVTAYFGRFPVARYRLVIQPAPGGSGILSGTTWGSGGARSRIVLGEHTTTGQLARDWVMTHEMVHTAFPEQPESHHWIEEGTATYIEPLARSWVGGYPAAKVWTDLVAGLPDGLPQDGDRGLDHTATWGRTYWGGALFCLLADVEIRTRTNGTLGLVDALRGMVAAGGNDQVDWSIARAFATADKAVGVRVLEDLYAHMKDEPVTPDLAALWRELGVSVRGGELELDEQAPRAAIRRAISARPRGVPSGAPSL